MSKLIIYPRTDGGVCILYPSAYDLSDTEAIKSDVPTGIPYLFIDQTEIPANRIQRNSLQFKAFERAKEAPTATKEEPVEQIKEADAVAAERLENLEKARQALTAEYWQAIRKAFDEEDSQTVIRIREAYRTKLRELSE